jgi:CMP/dCMP kinase
MRVIVAIDGPSGVGKSTTSKAVARALGVPHIDTGAMYRAIALKALRLGIPLEAEAELGEMAEGTAIEFEPGGDQSPLLLLDGRDVSAEIRSEPISMAASAVSAVPAVRRALVRLQQEMGRRHGGVLEGRDIGTKVFPETPHKFFLTARPEVRAGRRYLELRQRGVDATPESVLDDLGKRDRQDSTRADSPLTWDDSYLVIDNSEMSFEDVVGRIVSEVRRRESPSS